MKSEGAYLIWKKSWRRWTDRRWTTDGWVSDNLHWLCHQQAKKWQVVDNHTQTLGNSPVLGPRPVKTAEDCWKPLLCRSSCPVKKNLLGAPLWGLLFWKKMRSCKSVGGPVKLVFSKWLPVLQSGKGPKVFPMSAHTRINITQLFCTCQI